MRWCARFLRSRQRVGGDAFGLHPFPLRVLVFFRLPRKEAEATDSGGLFEMHCAGCCTGDCRDTGEPGHGASSNSNRRTHFKEPPHPPLSGRARHRRACPLIPPFKRIRGAAACTCGPYAYCVGDNWLVSGRPTGGFRFSARKRQQLDGFRCRPSRPASRGWGERRGVEGNGREL